MSHLVTSSSVFGLSSCIWSVLRSYFWRTAPEFELEADRDPLKRWISVHMFGSRVHTYTKPAKCEHMLYQSFGLMAQNPPLTVVSELTVRL